MVQYAQWKLITKGKEAQWVIPRSLKDGDEKPCIINTCYQNDLLCTFGKVGATSVGPMLHQYLHFHFNLKTLQWIKEMVYSGWRKIYKVCCV
jgi:hypothetical protein